MSRGQVFSHFLILQGMGYEDIDTDMTPILTRVYKHKNGAYNNEGCVLSQQEFVICSRCTANFNLRIII